MRSVSEWGNFAMELGNKGTEKDDKSQLLFCSACGADFFAEMGRCPYCDSHRGLTGCKARFLKEAEYETSW